jgi:hypothetical protein
MTAISRSSRSTVTRPAGIVARSDNGQNVKADQSIT